MFPADAPLSFSRMPSLPLICDTSFETEAIASGARLIAGIDEVGRGALAGPVVAAAVILDLSCVPVGLNDSKKLTVAMRNKLDAEIRTTALAFAIARVEAEEIDRINILRATRKAMCKAISALQPAADYLLLDAVSLHELKLPQKSIIKGDAKSVSIAAASIVAKVARDRWMTEYEEAFPGYGFRKNVGYGTAEHLQALRESGPTKIHRLTFRKVLPATEQVSLF